jgi:hypothetical protein
LFGGLGIWEYWVQGSCIWWWDFEDRAIEFSLK